MREHRRYLRSDMAEECCDSEQLSKGVRGIRFSEENIDGFRLSRLTIETEEGEKILGKPKGRYVTIELGKIWLAEDERYRLAERLLSREIRLMAGALTEENGPILIAGLGNRKITSDAIGPLTVEGLTVTRHIKESDRTLFDRLGLRETAAVAPGVVGQTGIETVELLRGAAETVRPSLVLCIDALAAKSIERLAVTVQLSDSGISPGSGIGNRRKAISKDTLGVPVLALGIPTVVDSSTLILDALERAGIEELPSALTDELNNGRSFFVTLKDTDVVTNEWARLLTAALNDAFTRF